MRKFLPTKNAPADTILPKRGSKYSAGYDFYAPEDIICKAHSLSKLVMFNVKCYILQDEYLAVMVRSSLAVKHGLQVAQGTAVIDADYADNPANDGNVGICFVNNSNIDYVIRKGERCAQGIFIRYYLTDDDDAESVRSGGYGSTGK
ncbi:MAG: dUTP diphosphatase [Phascolarctobacterium sp.]